MSSSEWFVPRTRHWHCSQHIARLDSCMWDMIHPCVTWRMCRRFMCVVALRILWHLTRLCVTWLMYFSHDSCMCDITHVRVTCLMYVWHEWCMCDMTHVCVTWLICVWHDSCTCDTPHVRVTRLILQEDYFGRLPRNIVWLDSWIWICHMTHVCMT